ncbi:hypothetical protein ACFQY4_14030 [Catellatospora bangladeshensis]|uniref:Uncharacterized protein n=1 Tax=Catellatospora bangladeshensis TaxID=310355 RepID=A0A8J3JJ74_9ACTN|nr:hypothetical protein [Catellatospora bangladeshensis]GIF83549.1 hypothetical protein Cba03nite_48980 [Catellatospora bangladeshensis]
MRRIVTVVVLVWLVSGVVAASRRDYFAGSSATCDHVSTIAATIVAGPLNYTGADPQVTC